MTNMEATYRYRGAVKALIKDYREQLRFLHKAHGQPVPLTPECAFCMTLAWDNFMTRLHFAGMQLNRERAKA